MKSNNTNWEWKKLGEICLSKAQYGSGARKIDFDDKVRYIRITDIDDGGNLKNDEFVSPSIIENDCFLEKDDLLFARSGSVGRTYLHSKNDLKYQFAGYLIRFKINPKIADARYVFYVTKSKYYLGWVESLKRNVTISNINAKEYSSFELPVPPLPIQQKIVSILEQAESLKQKREQANEEANKIIQSVFYKMFGDVENHKVKSFLDVFDVTTGKLDSNAAEPDGKYPFFTCSRETFKINSYDFDCEALLLAGNNAAAKYSVKYYSGKFNHWSEPH
ncbi:MAG TPA: restriction endonuclease subunit S [Candidatus Nanoarchaeia archaeon]|nr:restriction endonuclease subunit S [Candidatus Nanoarchaeia archaeon]